MTKLISVMAGLALAGGTAWALAQEAPANEEGGRRGRRGGPSAAWLLEKYDANKDGKLDQQELEAAGKDREGRHAAMKARVLERFDANKNGVLDPEEKAAAKAAFEQRRAKFVKRFDTNGDGKLDDAEREAARKEFHGREHKEHQDQK